MRVRYGALTEQGCVRKGNEDCFYLGGVFRERKGQKSFSVEGVYDGEYLTCAVFDGIGGLELGEEAALRSAHFLKDCDCRSFMGSMRSFFYEANDIICEAAEDSNVKMGCTAVVLHIGSENAVTGSIGDSKCYFFHEGVLRQLTEDHTEVLEMEAGRNVLTQCLGIPIYEYPIEPDINENIRYGKGDVFLLCSDGLTDYLSENEITVMLRAGGADEPLNICRKLISAAVAAGGEDNITVEVVEIMDIDRV